MLATDGPAMERLARVMRLRRRQFAVRIIVAAVVAGIFFGFTGWVFATIWFVGYVGFQVLELELFRRVDLTSFLQRPRNYHATLGLLAANTLLLGGFGLAEALAGGPWGLACACLLWAGSIMNSVVVSIGSKDAFLSQALVCSVFYLSAPFVTLAAGAPWIDAGAVIMAGALNLLVAVTVWAAAQKLFEAESEAREELERKTREAEAATAAKSAFVAMVSHELRTPISAILAGAAEVQRASADADIGSHGALITDSARMMRTLLNDLLDLSKIEAGHMSVETITFDLRALVLDTVKLWSTEIRKKRLRLKLIGAGGLPQWVEGDPTRIKQILNNLFSNAVKFTDAGAITLRILTEVSDAGEERALLTVEDTGPGLEPEQLQRLFRAFEQLGAATARKHGGTGLGLAISRDLALLMGGALTATSAPGSGAAFTLTLPIRRAAAPADVAEAAAPFGERPLRILIADDHEVNRRAFTLMLQAISAEVQAVPDGAAALEALATTAFDLVLMDVNMPRLGGHEATRRLRRGGGVNASIPVVALTGADGPEEAAACRAAGMDAFVTKPVEAGELIAAIENALLSREPDLAAAG